MGKISVTGFMVKYLVFFTISAFMAIMAAGVVLPCFDIYPFDCFRDPTVIQMRTIKSAIDDIETALADRNGRSYSEIRALRDSGVEWEYRLRRAGGPNQSLPGYPDAPDPVNGWKLAKAAGRNVYEQKGIMDEIRFFKTMFEKLEGRFIRINGYPFYGIYGGRKYIKFVSTQYPPDIGWRSRCGFVYDSIYDQCVEPFLEMRIRPSGIEFTIVFWLDPSDALFPGDAWTLIEHGNFRTKDQYFQKVRSGDSAFTVQGIIGNTASLFSENDKRLFYSAFSLDRWDIYSFSDN